MAVELLVPGQVTPGSTGVQADQRLVIREHKLGLGARHGHKGPDLTELDSRGESGQSPESWRARE